jgi:serine/threonine protein kinase
MGRHLPRISMDGQWIPRSFHRVSSRRRSTQIGQSSSVKLEPDLRNYLNQLQDAAEGLAYLHENDIVHGDIKGLNALVGPYQRVVLCDFGLSKLESTVNTSTGGLGSPYWQSPELMLGGPRTKEADVYAFGIMVYEVPPYCGYI